MSRKYPGRLGLLLFFAAMVYSLTLFPLAQWIDALVEWSGNHPAAGPFVYIGFVVVATVLFLPGSIAMMIGGFLFGFFPGLLLAACAIALGAQSAFEAGRWIARPWVRRQVATRPRMHAIEAALRERAFLIVVLTRLSLIIPFNLLNYAYGATSVRAATHFIATTVGMLPAIGLYVYLGTMARDLGQILSGQSAPPELGYWVLGAGIVAIVGVTWVIHRAATQALEKQLKSRDEVEISE